MGLTKAVAQRCHELNFKKLPEEVKDRIKYLLLDYLAVAIRGSQTESSFPVHRLISRMQTDTSRGVPVIGTGLKADAPYAALANGIAAHSLELDDVVNAASLHPGVTVMSAALSAAYLSECSGEALMEGIAAGYEVTVKLGVALDPAAHYAQGFHPTGTCGALGAAVTAAKILKLDESGIANAMGIAGSQAAGSMEFLTDGAYTKRFHAGWAAHSGLIAALLASEGFTGPKTIIEGKFGFLNAYSPAANPEKLLQNWAGPYEIMKTSIKPHACCRYKQGPIDCILQIVGEKGLTGKDIEKVTVSILKAGFDLVAEPREMKLNPRSIVDAQFSMPFGGAVAILQGNAFLEQYTMENVRSPAVRDLMGRIYCKENPEIEKEFPQKWPAEVEITTKEGEKYHTRLNYPKGDPENPLSWDEIIEKFNRLALDVFSEEKCSAIVEQVQVVEDESDVKGLIEQLKA